VADLQKDAGEGFGDSEHIDETVEIASIVELPGPTHLQESRDSNNGFQLQLASNTGKHSKRRICMDAQTSRAHVNNEAIRASAQSVVCRRELAAVDRQSSSNAYIVPLVPDRLGLRNEMRLTCEHCQLRHSHGAGAVRTTTDECI
jgi:hypothetical protein